MATPVWMALASLSRLRKDEETKERREYERWRMLGFWILRPHQKSNSSMEPETLVKFPWEGEQDESRAKQMIDRLIKEGKVKAPKG